MPVTSAFGQWKEKERGIGGYSWGRHSRSRYKRRYWQYTSR